MKHYSTLYLLSIIAAIALIMVSSCQSDKKETPDKAVQQLLPDAPAEVTTTPLTLVDFEHELVSNGKIKAQTVAELKFQTGEVIAKIFVKNGSHVKQGQRIAELETYALSNRLNQSKDALERSRLEYQDVLIGQGYKLDNPEAVPDEIMQLAKVKSGYNSAQTQFDMASYDLKKASLVAPISGVVANLFAKPHSIASQSDVFCNIIDTRSLEVEFTVLENELGFIKMGDNVKIAPFSIPDLVVNGRVTEINPWVDENGMVQIKASVSYNARLVEGMNVRVSTFRSAGKQWVVPKTAVVLRNGKQVVFSVVNGKAIWNYVDTGLENATQYTITGETLKEGDQIVVTGNINLAHESPVELITN